MSDISKFAINGYDDKPERMAFRRLINEDVKIRKFIIEYMNLKKSTTYNIIDDPLGKYAVDLGIVDTKTGNLVGLVEVDVFFIWKDEWPSFYKWCHRLERKEKYWIDTPYPYVNITFSTNHKNGIMTTREIESRYPIKKKWFKQKKMWEQLREVPISSAIKIGEWA